MPRIRLGRQLARDIGEAEGEGAGIARGRPFTRHERLGTRDGLAAAGGYSKRDPGDEEHQELANSHSSMMAARPRIRNR